MNDNKKKLKEAIGYMDELMNAEAPEFEVETALRNEKFILELLTKHEKDEYVEKKSLLSKKEIKECICYYEFSNAKQGCTLEDENCRKCLYKVEALLGKIKKVKGVEEKIKDLIAHEIFCCAYYALKGADKRDTDKLAEAITKALTKP